MRELLNQDPLDLIAQGCLLVVVVAAITIGIRGPSDYMLCKRKLQDTCDESYKRCLTKPQIDDCGINYVQCKKTGKQTCKDFVGNI